MKAAIVEGSGKVPVYADFPEPVAGDGEVLIEVSAAALSQVTRARASGEHYSASTVFPFIVGIDGTGRRADGSRTYFFLPRAPFGSMAERTVARESFCVPLPEGIDDITAAALAIPGMSSWLSLKARARLAPGEVVLINGATGLSGRLAVQIARLLGAGKVIATGRNREVLGALSARGADVVIPLTGDYDALEEVFRREVAAGGVDIVLDYLWGPSAERLLVAVAQAGDKGRATRFIQLGSAGGSTITLLYSALRSHPLEMMGCGIGSVSYEAMLRAVGEVLRAGVTARFDLATKAVPVAAIESCWTDNSSTVRTVFVTERH